MNVNKFTEQQAEQERQKYVTFNDTMLRIWQEQITRSVSSKRGRCSRLRKPCLSVQMAASLS